MTPKRSALWLTLYLFLGAVLLITVVYPQTLAFSDSLLPPYHGPAQRTDLQAYTTANYKEVFHTPYYLGALWNSLWISAVSVLAAAAIGVPCAFLVERARFRGRTLVLIASVLPLALPPLVGAYAFFELARPPGIVPGILSHLTGFTADQCSFGGAPAVLLVHAYSFSIYFFALTRAGLASLDPTLESAARSLGASFRTRLTRILLPGLTPYLIAAALLTFMTSMSSFSAPYILAKGLPYLTVEINNDYNGFPERAAVIAAILATSNTIFLLILQLGFGGAWRALGGGSKGATASGAGASSPLGSTTPTFTKTSSRLIAFALATTFCLAMAAPFVLIVLTACANHDAWNANHTVLPPVWTTEAFQWVWADPRAQAALLTSALATLCAVILNLLFACAAALFIVRGSRIIRFLTDFACMLPIALPGTVIAFNLLRAFSAPSTLTFGVSLSNTFAILVLAYFVRQLPLAIRPVVAATAKLDPVLELAAQTLGATPGTIFRRVLLPQLWPGILAAALLCTVAGLGEFVASELLFSQFHMPISIAIEQEIRTSKSHAAALSLVLVAITVLILTAYALLTRRRR